MCELSEEERQEITELFNSLDDGYISFVAIDQKYGRDFYREQVQQLEVLREYFEDIRTVMNAFDVHDQADLANQHVELVSALIESVENVDEELDTRKMSPSKQMILEGTQ